jgi:hypothetical protein
MRTRCTFEGCPHTTERPIAPGWKWLQDWEPGIKAGYYCPQHAAALEALHMSGELGADCDEEEPEERP